MRRRIVTVSSVARIQYFIGLDSVHLEESLFLFVSVLVAAEIYRLEHRLELYPDSFDSAQVDIRSDNAIQ